MPASAHLDLAGFSPDPFVQFEKWFDEAKADSGMRYPDSCCLSTITPDGHPDGRFVLLREFDASGFVFYTNTESDKGRALAKLPEAGLAFFWDRLKRQVRLRGPVEPVSDEQADRYFAGRNRLSQLGAWASFQSRSLSGREILEERFKRFEEEFSGKPVPRPPHWSGYRIVPERIEFWQEREHRLHDRFLYLKQAGAWQIQRLYP